MTKPLHWFKLYSSDFLAGVATLTAAERGVYITILAAIYDNGGPIPDNRRRLARLCNTSNSVLAKALDELVDCGKLQIVGGYITNKRAETEIRNQVLLRNKSKLGGEIRQQKQPSASETPQPKSSHIRSQKPEARKEKDPTGSKKKSGSDGTRLPPDWTCPSDWMNYALKKGMTHDQAEETATDFADYWIAKAGPTARKVDWKRTWERWIREEVSKSGGGSTAGSSNRRGQYPANRSAANTARRRDALRAALDEAPG